MCIWDAGSRVVTLGTGHLVLSLKLASRRRQNQLPSPQVPGTWELSLLLTWALPSRKRCHRVGVTVAHGELSGFSGNRSSDRDAGEEGSSVSRERGCSPEHRPPCPARGRTVWVVKGVCRVGPGRPSAAGGLGLGPEEPSLWASPKPPACVRPSDLLSRLPSLTDHAAYLEEVGP